MPSKAEVAEALDILREANPAPPPPKAGDRRGDMEFGADGHWHDTTDLCWRNDAGHIYVSW